MPVTIQITADSAQAAANLQQFARVAEQAFNQTATAAARVNQTAEKTAILTAGQLKSTARALSGTATNLVYTASLFAGPQVQSAVYPLMMIGKEVKGVSAAMKLMGITAPVAVAALAAATGAVTTGVMWWQKYKAELQAVEAQLSLIRQRGAFSVSLRRLIGEYEGELGKESADRLRADLAAAQKFEDTRKELAALEEKQRAWDNRPASGLSQKMMGLSPLTPAEEERLKELRNLEAASLDQVQARIRAHLRDVLLTEQQKKNLEEIGKLGQSAAVETFTGFDKEREAEMARYREELQRIDELSRGINTTEGLHIIQLNRRQSTLAHEAKLAEIERREATEEAKAFYAAREQATDEFYAREEERARQAAEEKNLGDQIRLSFAQTLDARMEVLNLQEAAEKAHVDKVVQDHARAEELKTLITQEYAVKRLQVEREGAQASAQVRAMQLQGVRTMFDNMANATRLFGAKGFAAYKAFAIAGATMDTYQAAIAAYKSVVGIPYVGPALAPLAAAAAVAAGLASVQQIAAQSPPGREHGGPVEAGMPYIVGERRPELFVPSTDGYIMPSVPARGTPGRSGTDSPANVRVYVVADLREIARREMESERGAQIIVQTLNGRRLDVGLNT